jgi:hypothetical protein
VGLCTLRNCVPMRNLQLHLHDGPMLALPEVSAYLRMDYIDYFEQCTLHVLLKSFTFYPQIALPTSLSVESVELCEVVQRIRQLIACY